MLLISQPSMQTVSSLFRAEMTLLLLLNLLLCGASAAEVVQEFSYEGELGPEYWGSLDPEWSVCSSGLTQSPINIQKKDVIKSSNLGDLGLDNIVGEALLHLTDHDIAVEWKSDQGNHSIRGEMYEFDHLHFHAPSDHAINGLRYPLEMHKVHESSDGNISVVSVLFKYGKADPFIDQISSKLHSMVKKNETELELGVVEFDVSSLGSEYYRYIGSLTTPPCTQGVTWTILRKKRSITEEQVKAFMEAAGGANARPLQELNGRPVFVHP